MKIYHELYCLLTLTLILLILAPLSACSSSSHTTMTATPTPTTATTPMPMTTMSTTTPMLTPTTTTVPTSATTTISSSAAGQSITINLVAQNIAFDQKTITVPAGASVIINFDNKDHVPHNFALYTDSSASKEIFVGKIITATTITYEFTAPSTPGNYFFRCDVHPSIMTGTFVVQ